MTAAPAPTKRFVQRKAAIVGAAVEVINRKGVRAMTLAEVAARLNLVPTGVIYYFRNKEALASAAFLEGIARFEGLIAAGRDGGGVRERLARFLDAYLDFSRACALGDIAPIVAFNDVRALNCAPVNQAYVDMFRAVRGLLDGPETQGLSRPALNARAHLLVSEILWTVAWLPQHEPKDYAEVSQRLLGVLADGLAAPGAPWEPVALPALGGAPEGREASSELFLRAATQLINDEGYVGASVEKISARLNVTKGAFYHHNETKDDLVVACFERTFQVMWRAIDLAQEAGASGLQTLSTIAMALVEHQASSHGPLLRASALTSAPEAIQPRLLAGFEAISQHFATLISIGVADGSIRPVDIDIGAQAITAMINAGSELHHWVPGVDPARAAALHVRPLFDGLLSPEPA